MAHANSRSALRPSTAALAVALAGALAAHAAEPDTDDALLDVPAFADEEPDIRFPACIGIARIENGAVTPIPLGEAGAWDEQFDLLGDAVGRTVDVLMTSSADPGQAVADIRADGQEAGLDYVVVYEVAYDEARQTDPSAIERLRVFPTFEGEDTSQPGRAAGAAVLLDVADGRMYGVASAVTRDNEADYAAEQTAGDARAGAFQAVVTELAHEVETAFVGIMIKAGLPDPQVAQAAADPEDLTPEQIVAQADREIRASYEEQANERGC